MRERCLRMLRLCALAAAPRKNDPSVGDTQLKDPGQDQCSSLQNLMTEETPGEHVRWKR